MKRDMARRWARDKITCHSFRELAQRLDGMDFQHRVEPGNIYWLLNSLLGFGDSSNGGRHPVLVIRVEDDMAEVCVLTSKVRRNQDNGLCHDIIPDAGLHRQGVIITSRFGRRWLRLTSFDRSNYGGCLGTEHGRILQQLTTLGGRLSFPEAN